MGYVNKNLKRLIIPYIITCIVYLIVESIVSFLNHDLTILKIAQSIIAMLIGIQSFEDGFGCRGMWFVYTLFIIKVTTYRLNKKTMLLVSLLSVVACLLLSKYELTWAVTDIFIATPIYYMGRLLSDDKLNTFIEYLKSLKIKYKLTLMIVLLSIAYNICKHSI